MSDTTNAYIERVIHAAPFADHETDRKQMVEVIRALQAERDALQAKLDAMKWQPIETAPKDGAEILVCVIYDVDGEQHSARWVDAFYGGRWIWFPKIISAPFEPTHWMPLPEPPEEA